MSQANQHEPLAPGIGAAETLPAEGVLRPSGERSLPRADAVSGEHRPTSSGPIALPPIVSSPEATTLSTDDRPQPVAEPAAPPPGWSAARLPVVERESYQIKSEVAQGGIGRILRARSVALNRPVALKELLTDAGPAAEERFVRASSAVAQALLTTTSGR